MDLLSLEHKELNNSKTSHMDFDSDTSNFSKKLSTE